MGALAKGRDPLRLDEYRLCVRPGEGLVARFPTSVLVVTAPDWAGMPAVDRLLEECRRATPAPLSERLADLIDDAGSQKVPAFCAIANDDDGLAFFVHGDSQVVITGAQPVMRLSGRGTAGWTGGIQDVVASLVVGPATGSPERAPTDDLVDLLEGVVPGAAIVLVPRGEPMPAAVRPLPMAEAEPSVVLAPPAAPELPIAPLAPADEPAPAPADEPARVAAPAPVAAPAAGAVPLAAVDGTPVMVWGVHCKRGHFNNPDARYCRMCGTHMVHQRRDPVLGPRPVLGFLILDDGTTYKLDADYVVGREPERDDAVPTGEARGLSLSDPEDSVSPVHAAIKLEKWDVSLTDRNSKFGTHVWKPGTAGWVRLEPGQKVMLEPRTHLLFGRRTMVFDSVNRR